MVRPLGEIDISKNNLRRVDSLSTLREEALHMHKVHQGKLETVSKVKVENAKDLSLAYSPGVAEPCKEIYDDKSKVYEYTMKGNMVAVVTDGTAVLGLGNIGPEASLPVMEGKAVLFKSFAGVDAFPIALNTNDVDKIVETVKLMEPTFGGVNLEDIAAPNCFIIEERLKKETNIPIFHDDQHGTAIVTVAGLVNALKLVGKKMSDIKVVANGAGAAGIAIIKLLYRYGVRDIIMCDRKGAIYDGRPTGMNPVKDEVAKYTNKNRIEGSLADVVQGADVFIGVSAEGALTEEMVRTMNDDAIIFAMANPVPEIMPELAKAAGAAVVGTGRSDFPNQVNNVLAFPGIFRGALDVHATQINEEMKMAAVQAIAELVAEDELNADYIIPAPFDARVAPVAGLVNALKLVGKKMSDIKVVANGAGAAGIAIIKLLYRYGVRDIIMCDRKGAIYDGRPTGMNPVKDEVAKYTNKNRIEGSLADVVQGADVFIGVSAEGALTEEMVRTMNDDAIIFAMANPVPEIMPELAKAAGAAVVGTGRSDFPNQVNNVLAFPGIFRGALDVHATQINEEMKMAAVQAIAELVAEDELNADYIIPAPFDARVAPQVAAYVAKAAMETGVARRQVDPNEIAEKTKQLALIGKE